MTISYLDHAASTPMSPAAIEAMTPYFSQSFANPSGLHRAARDARKAVDEAREQLAVALGGKPGEIIFCGSGTEAANLAVFGSAGADSGTVICSAIEHHAVLHSVERQGGRTVQVLPSGAIDLDHLEALLRNEMASGRAVRLVSVMASNNETGVMQPLREVAKLVRKLAPRALLHTDAVNAFPWMDIASVASKFDLINVGAHKFGGPKGVGVLLARESVKIESVIVGGGQERERRSGTHNVAGIVATGVAAERCVAAREETTAHVRPLRDELLDGLLTSCETARETGDRSLKTPSVSALTFDGIEGEALLVLLDQAGVYASAGSSCSSGALEPSHVLQAMGISKSRQQAALRLSLGSTSTRDDVTHALREVPLAVARLQGFARGGMSGLRVVQ